MSLIAFDSRPPRADLVSPFEHPGVGGKPGCLLLHGFGCSPHTMRGLGEALSDAGYPCYAPLLPGHGESIAEFNEVSYFDWLEAAEMSHAYLKDRYQKVVVVGFSMGGSLGLHLASKLPVEALVVLATPVFLDHWVERVYPVARAVTSALPVVFDVASRAARRRRMPGVHKVIPVNAVGQLMKLLEEVKTQLTRVECPILIAQSRSDHTVPPTNAPYIAREVSSETRRLLWLRRAYHVLPVDYGCQRIEREVVRFLAEHA